MKFGIYNAILHDRTLPEAISVVKDLGLSGIEINTGGFIPPVHVPNLDTILVSDAARDDFLAMFDGTGVSIAGLNCNGNPLHPNDIIGDAHSQDLRRTIRLAHRLGQLYQLHIFLTIFDQTLDSHNIASKTNLHLALLGGNTSYYTNVNID
jgi:sugar phosphate isomerase/epimerase